MVIKFMEFLIFQAIQGPFLYLFLSDAPTKHIWLTLHYVVKDILSFHPQLLKSFCSDRVLLKANMDVDARFLP